MNLDDRVAEILGEFRARRDRGEAVDAEEVIAANPDLASRLRAEFTAMRLLNAVGARVALARGERPPSAPREGERFGPYRIVRTLGRGGSATVHLAEQEAPLQRRVALKVLHESLLDAQATARFDVEREALTRLGHPNVARVLDAGATADGQLYVVMEYVDGVDVVTYCERGKVTLEERLRLFTDVCDAVHHAHQKGLIHRDIKPANVLVTEIDGRPTAKVIDFGLAKPVGDGEARVRTAHGQVVGTPAYMSPEQARGQPVDTRTDVYALGMLLYELLTGDLPWERSPASEVGLGVLLRRVLEEDPPKPSTRVTRQVPAGDAGARQAARWASRLRGDLDWIVLKALAKEPERRYASAQALAEDVGRHLRHEAVEAGPPSVTYRMRKFVRRHRLAVAASVVAVAALAVGLGAALRAYGTADRQREELLRLAQFVVFDLQEGMQEYLGLAEDERDPEDPQIGALQRAAERLLTYCEGEFGSEAADLRSIAHNGLGLAHFLRGDHPRAIGHYRQALRDRPAFATASHNLGLALAATGRPEEAVAQYRRALELKPDFSAAHTALGYCLRAKGDLAGAEASYREALRTGSSDYDAMWASLGLGHLLQEKGDLQRAIAAWEEALRVKPDCAEAMSNLATVRRDQGHLDEALRLASEAVRLRPRYAGAKANLGLVLLARGEADAARVAIEEAHRLAPGEADAKRVLGIALREAGDLKGAIAAFREALLLRPGDVDALEGLGETLSRSGDAEGAIAAYREAMGIRPGSATILSGLGQVLTKHGSPEEGVALCREAVRLAPDQLHAVATLGVVLSWSGDLDGAITQFRSALAIVPNDAVTRRNLAEVLKDKRDWEGAREHLVEALRLRPKWPEALVSLGEVYDRLEGHPRAIQCYREALEVSPGHAGALMALGETLYAAGDVPGAIEALRSAVASDSRNWKAHATLAGYHTLQGEAQAAVASCRRALELRPHDVGVLINASNAFLAARDVPEALAIARRAVKARGDLPEARMALGNALHEGGDYGEAIREYQEALRLRPGLAEAVCNIGRSLHALGDREGAIARYRKALALEPDLFNAAYNLANTLWHAGRPEEALSPSLEAIRIAPRDAEALYLLGAVQFRMGDLAAGAMAFRQVLSLRPDFPDAALNLAVAYQVVAEDLEESIGWLRKSIALVPGRPNDLRSLGEHLLRMGDLSGARGAFLAASAAGDPGAASEATHVEGLIARAADLSAVLADPTDSVRPADLLRLAQHGHQTGRHVAAFRLFERAIPAEGPQTGDPGPYDLRKAAASALLAGMGHGADAWDLDGPARKDLRNRALAWLRAGMEALEARSPKGAPLVAELLDRWKSDPDFARVREGSGLADLPPDEQEGWQAFWRDLEALSTRLKSDPVAAPR